ncbi:MAG: hypothetical protein HY841_07805 [Bacteroidetes bacterium]|nr:hypothetical protein [Bacteroidota bacterium]
MHAAQNYIYIVFAVIYIIYSIIKAGKKVTKNRPTTIPNSSSQKKDEFKPVQPPEASPIPNHGDDMKKMLEDLLGRNPEVKIPEKHPDSYRDKVKHQPVSIKPQPSKITTHSIKEKTIPSHVPSKTHKTAAQSFLTGEQLASSKKVFLESEAEEESVVDFDIRQAIIYSEILKRPQY